MLDALTRLLGVNPLQLAGVPTGFFFTYFIVCIAVLPLAVPLGRYLGQSRAPNAARVGIILTVVMAVFANQAIYESLFIEDPDDQVQVRGEPHSGNLIVPLPFPVIRGSAFDDYLPGGRYHRLTRGVQLRSIVLSQELKVSTYTTVALHLATLAVTLLGLATAAVVGIAAATRSLRRGSTARRS